MKSYKELGNHIATLISAENIWGTSVHSELKTLSILKNNGWKEESFVEWNNGCFGGCHKLTHADEAFHVELNSKDNKTYFCIGG